MALLPGDVVTIYSQKDVRGPVSRQTRLVSIEGEVNAPGVYQLIAGDTLRSVACQLSSPSARARPSAPSAITTSSVASASTADCVTSSSPVALYDLMYRHRVEQLVGEEDALE